MGGWHRGGSQEYTFTAMKGADVLSGSDDNLNNGDSFTMGFGATACITVTDNDSSLSGDARRNEQGDDRRGQTADIEVNGISVHGDAKIYAEQAYVLHDQDGNCYFMVEIEVAGAANTDLDDFYAFIGDAPPAGAVLTVVGQHNVFGNWVKYRDLSAGLKWDLDENGKVTIEAEDMALSNYRIDDVDAASGREVIKLKRGEGEASVIFGAESGNYDMEVAYVDENDGQGAIEVLVNGVLVRTIALDQDNNGSGYDNSTISTVVIEGLNLNQGDAVVLRGTRDGNEFARIDSITFCEANHAPIAMDDNDSVVEGGTLTLNLLANDTDEDGDTLTVTDAGGEVAGTPFGVITDGGRNVQVTVTGTGVLTFVAAAVIFDSLAVGQTDSFTFNYTISDGNGEGDTAAVTVTIVGENDGPAVSGAITASASEDDAAFSVDLLDGASDIDNGAVLTVQNLVLTSGEDAGVTVNGNSIDIDPTAYNSLAVNASEILAYSYDIVDEHGALVSQTATITIDGVNDLTDGDELNEGALASAGTVSQQLLDALSAAEAELVRLEVARQILIDKGDFSQPVAAQFALFFARADRAIEDAEADIAAAAVPVDLTNVLANTDDPEPGAPFVLRVDGAATSVGAAVAGDNGGLFTIRADGAATFSTNGEFSGLAIGDSAVTSITYTVGDVDGGEDQSTITVTVNGVNDAPLAAPLAVSGDEDTAISGQLVAVDPDVGDVLTYSLQSQSLIGTTTVNPDGTFTWNPGNNGKNFNGDVTFEYRVIDGNGGTDVETVTVTVNPVNDLTDGDEPNEEALATAGSVSQQLLDALGVAQSDLAAAQRAYDRLFEPKKDGAPATPTQQEVARALGDLLSAETALERAGTAVTEAQPAALSNVLDNAFDPEPGDPFVARVDGAAAGVGGAVAGDNGGLFTIDADGAALFSANGDFEDVLLGETVETSITYTVADLDGGEDQSTITVSVAGNNRVPIFFGSGPLPNGAAGSMNGAAPYTFDVAPLFDDFDDDALAFTATGLPSGFALINGVLTQTDPVDPAGAGDHTASISADDGRSGVTTADLAFSVALLHDFGDDFASGATQPININGSSLGDTAVFGDEVAAVGAITVATGRGNDAISFGEFAAVSGQARVEGGDGADMMSFGLLSALNGAIDAFGGDGGDTFIFGNSAASRGSVKAEGGDGDDMITFGDSAGNNEGSIFALGGVGDDTIRFGSTAAYQDGAAIADGGVGNDTIEFGQAAGNFNGMAIARGGVGDDIITFANDAAAFGGNIRAEGGTGADTITIGSMSDQIPAALSAVVDLGAGDGASDTLVFTGRIDGVDVENWEAGVDNAVDVVDPNAWSGVDDGSDTTFTAAGGQVITFVGVTGVLLDDFLM